MAVIYFSYGFVVVVVFSSFTAHVVALMFLLCSVGCSDGVRLLNLKNVYI